MGPRRFTSSELRQWQQCRRTWYLRYFLGYGVKRDPGEVGAASTGTLVHSGLEAYYVSGFDAPAAVDAVKQKVLRNLEELAEAGKEHLFKAVNSQGEMARIMLEGYFEWAETDGIDADLIITGAEKEIEAPFAQDYLGEKYGREVTLLGKADLLATRRSTGERLILDFKTVMSGSDQEILAPMSPQFKHYAVILRQNGAEPVEGAVVRWLRRVKRTARATPPFYGEVPVMWSQAVLRSYYSNTLSLIEEILTAEARLQAGARPEDIGLGPTVSRDCTRCLFRPVCPLLDDETVDATDVLRWSYQREDPLARYGTNEGGDDE